MCIAGAGQLFLEVMQTEAIVNALLQDTAEFAVTLDNNDFFSTILPCAVSSRQTGRATANNNYII